MNDERSIGAASPNMPHRQGCNNTTVKVGPQITAMINPLRNGAHDGTFLAATHPGGETIGNPTGRPPG